MDLIKTNNTEDAVSKKIESLIQHLVHKIYSTPVFNEPFSHMYFENFFPDDIYEEILASLPDLNFYDDLIHPDALRTDGTSTRKEFLFLPDKLSKIPTQSSRLLSIVNAAIQSPEVLQAMCDQLKQDLGKRFRVPEDKVKDLKFYPRTGLFCDQAGYKISPHPDIKIKAITTQFYLPKDNSQKDMGTEIYKRTAKGYVIHQLKKLGLPTPDEFETVKTFAFLRNSGYAFAVSKNSWHGRSQLSSDSQNRHTLMHIYYTEQKHTSTY